MWHLRGGGALLLGLLLGVCVLACTGSTGGLAVATDVADSWAEAWNQNDPAMMDALFTEYGRYESFNGITYVGNENGMHVIAHGALVTNVIRIGDVATTDDGNLTWLVEAELAGIPSRGKVGMTLDGELISHLWWTEKPAPFG